MRNTSRRKFIRNTSLTATGTLFVAPIVAEKNAIRNPVVSCGAQENFKLAGTITSVQSGNWSDHATWDGKVPKSSDVVLISPNHVVVFDGKHERVSGINISSGGILKFDSTKDTELETSGNIVVEGTLQMQSNSPAISQCLLFVDVKENKFIGGGHDVLDSDVGLWVVGNGQLDLVGAEKTSWTRAIGELKKGASTIEVIDAKGWNIGDEIAITPTDFIHYDSDTGIPTGFEERTIKSISGSMITLDKKLEFDHPEINNRWTAEVMNLTRNVRIEGTSKGQSHIMITAKNRQVVKHIQLRFMGPRKDTNGDGIREFVLGRYNFHFHHAGDGSRGSLIEGCVVREAGSHSYVPHASHGVTFKNNVSYDVLEVPFWYDPGHITHDTIFDGNIAALVKYVPGALDMTGNDPLGFPKMHCVSGFLLGVGDGNVCMNNVVAGLQEGDPHNGGAYDWMANNEGVWTFQNNLAHHTTTGIFVWQNTSFDHVIENYEAYHNKSHAIFHGAYGNVYRYVGGVLFANNVEEKAISFGTARVRIENMIIDGNNKIDYCIDAISSQLKGTSPILIRNCTFDGFKVAPVRLTSNLFDSGRPNIKNLDIIHCTFLGEPVIDPSSHDAETIRVQNKDGSAYKITKNGKEAIPKFAPDLWGTGTGLKAEYFNSVDFTNKVLERVDSNIGFDEWGSRQPYQISAKPFSVRWTGKIQPQYSEKYEFIINNSGTVRMWIEGNEIPILQVAVADTHIPISEPVDMIAGNLYNIKIEFQNNSRSGVGVQFSWRSPSLENLSPKGEIVPQSQLYSDNGALVSPIVNKLPISNAGADLMITLPQNSVTLNGTGSKDPDGETLASYAWTRIGGPSQFTLENPNSATTALKDLVAGTYIFRLKVIDTNGVTDEDDVVITVIKQQPNQGPVANAGSDATLTLPTSSTTLNGSASSHPNGSIVGYKWTKISGPSEYLIVSPNSVISELNALVQGTYVFRLEVTDNHGATHHADIAITVQAGASSEAELLTSLHIIASPNPSPSTFKIQVTSNSDMPIRLKILNRGGWPVTSFSNLKNNSMVSVGTFFKKGMYYAVAEQGMQRKIITLIKL